MKDNIVSLSIEEAGRLLLSEAVKGIDHLKDGLLPKIAEALNLTYDDYDPEILRRESLFLCLWAARKVLEGEEQKLTASFHEACARTIEKIEPKKNRELFALRCRQYDEAWDVESRGNQSILCINILAEMFTGGRHERELVNFWAFIQMTNFVLLLMKAVLDKRKVIKVQDSEEG